MEDLAAFCYEVGLPQWFGKQAKLQPTWSKFCRMILAAEGRPTDTEEVRRYQAEQLGRGDGNSCLMELLPLPSPSLKHWLYERRSQLPQLRDRQTYMEHYASARASHIRKRIAEHQPRAVVFSSVDARYMPWWRAIAGVNFERREAERRAYFVGERGRTQFVVTNHPVAMGITNAYFHEIGRVIGVPSNRSAE